jgi:diguanylate cyclase (GGDEF)-like protein
MEVGSGTGPVGETARLRSLMAIANAVGGSRRLAEVLELAAEQARTALDAASLSISRWEREDGRLRTLINVGALAPDEERFPTNEVYDLRKYTEYWRLLASGRSWRRQLGEPFLFERPGKGSEAATAIMFEGDVWGELWATRSIGRPPFTDHDLAFLHAVSSQVAAGLASAAYLERLERLAFTDPLTGLANRRGLDEQLGRALADPAELALVVCDVDGLKDINDRQGHAAGDEALVTVGEALAQAVAESGLGLAARIGGDEFCLLVRGSADAARAVAERTVALLAQRHSRLSISCGIASTAVARDAPGLLAAADAAQYAAKHEGAGVIHVAGANPIPPRPSRGRRRLRDRLEVTDLVTGEAPAQQLERLLDAAREHLRMEVAFVGQFSGTKGFRFSSAQGPTDVFGFAAGDELPIAETLCKDVFDRRAPLVLTDVGPHWRWGGIIGSYLGVPVVLDDGRLYGALCVIDRHARVVIEDREVRFLRALAGVVAGIVEGETAAGDQRHRVHARVRSLLDHDAFSMAFQPIRDLRDGSLVGVEALARFRGTTPTRRWFTDAAQVGLGIDLELAAVDAALGELPRVPPGAFLSANVSPSALASPRLARLVERVPPGRLVLELTENAPVDDYAALSAAMAALRAKGVRFAVDDAGAGYASLSHILRLSPEFIKLDLQLTRRVDSDPVRRALATGLAGFAAGTGATVVAEGIETAAEIAVLIDLGIPLGQGWRLGRPTALTALGAALAS